MKLIKALIFIISVTTITLLKAADPLFDKVKSELSDRIYPASAIIADYQRPLRNAPTFAVADLRTDGDELFAWSKAVSAILRNRIHFSPKVKLTMPDSLMLYSDSQYGDRDGLLVSHASFKNLYKSQGIQTVLTGKVDRSIDGIKLQMEFLDSDSGELIIKKIWKFQDKQLSDILIEISVWAYKVIGVELNANEMSYLTNPETLDISAINAYIEFMKEYSELPDTVKFTKLEALQKNYPKFILFAFEVLKHRIGSLNDAEAFKNLEFSKSIRSKFPHNAGVVYRSIKAIEVFGLPRAEAKIQFDALKRLIKDNPHNPSMMLDLGYGLVQNSESPEGISIMLEGVERWPNNYRSWWGLAWGLNQYAWQIRGNNYWRDVPDSAKEKFKSLSVLADRCADKALSMYSLHGTLWVNKLNTLGSRDGYSRDLMQAFDEAIKHAPHEQGIYKSAMNYSQDQWGGNSSSRLHISARAIENNPNEFWPEVMKEQYVSASDEVFGKIGLNKFFLWAESFYEEKPFWPIIFVLLIVYMLGKRNGNKELLEYLEDEDY